MPFDPRLSLMRVLLTGCEGQLGRSLARVLLSYGELRMVSREAFDLSSEAVMLPVLDRLRPDLIVNAAAYTAVDQAETDKEAAMLVNGVAPGVIARWAARNGARLLHYSTDYVFDGESTKPYREQDAANPVNFYGVTKLAGETAIRESGAKYLIIRTSWLYDDAGRNFLTTILRLAAEREEIRVVDDQTGTPTPTWWLAEVTGRLLTQGASGILHAAPRGTTTWYDFTRIIVGEAKNRGLPVTVKRVVPILSDAFPTPAKRPHYSVFELTRLCDELGITLPLWNEALLPVLDRIVAMQESR